MNRPVEPLAKSAALWLNSADPLRQETVRALEVSTGLRTSQLERALANCFEELAFEKLSSYAASLPVGGEGGTVYHVLPSNAFTAWVHGAVTTLLMGRRCAIKPSGREPVFANAWKKSLERAAPELAALVKIIARDEMRPQGGDTVVAYGADETLAAIRSALPSGVRFAGYGHKLSVGVIFGEAVEDGALESLIEQVAADADPFRLQGCLSPQILYMEKEDPSLRRALEARLQVLPKIRVFSEWPQAEADLRKFVPYLSCVGYAGAPARAAYLEKKLAGCGVSRICPLGQMQRPPLEWRNGGLFLPDLLN